MSSLLGSTSLYLAIALGLILAGLALLSLRNPIIGKLGVRNIPRRPMQSALIVLGLTLSTMIIVSALSLGDTLENTVRRADYRCLWTDRPGDLSAFFAGPVGAGAGGCD